MEGCLWKWTNYFSGWQPRWFILDNGVLSYFKSEDEVQNGSKGSVNMSVCNVIVHQTDNTRLDLDIPGEAHFYIRASTPAERQTWLIALGSCKACLSDPSSEELSINVNQDKLQQKKSELRLYCGELITQVQNIKQCVTSSKEGTPDLQKLDTATSLLSATCDMFITSLEGCMELSKANDKTPDSPRHVSPVTPISPNPFYVKKPSSRGITPHGTRPKRPHRTNSTSSTEALDVERLSLDQHVIQNPKPSAVIRPNQAISRLKQDQDFRTPNGDEASQISVKSPVGGSIDQTNLTTGGAVQSQGEPAETNETFQNIPKVHDQSSQSVLPSDSYHGNSLSSSSPSDASQSDSGSDDRPLKHVTFTDSVKPVSRPVQTFFSTMTMSFEDVRISEDGSIPVKPFLESCKSLIAIFDKMGSTAFAPVKMDVAGNIRKIQHKCDTNPAVFKSLQTIVIYEKNMGQYQNSNSATVALLWLRRGLQFLKETLEEVSGGQPDLSSAITNAYGTTLKPFHGWIVRGVFSLAVKAVPYMDNFIETLAYTHKDFNHPEFKKYLMRDVESYTTALDVFIRILRDFYESQNLETDGQV